MNPFAIWACGAPGSGKSSISKAAVLPLGFELIDVDQTYEFLLNTYHLSLDHRDEKSEPKAHSRSLQDARRLAESLAKKEAADGKVDPQTFITRLTRLVQMDKFNYDLAHRLIDRIHKNGIFTPLSVSSFRKALFPTMSDWADPMDYLKDKTTLSRGHLLTVAREITRRRIASCRKNKQNLLFVETGGQTGRLIKLKHTLEMEGYRTLLLWFHLDSVDEALKRNTSRMESGGRGINPGAVRRSFQAVTRARPKLMKAFHPNTTVIENNRDGQEYIHAKITEIQNFVRRWIDQRKQPG